MLHSYVHFICEEAPEPLTCQAKVYQRKCGQATTRSKSWYLKKKHVATKRSVVPSFPQKNISKGHGAFQSFAKTYHQVNTVNLSQEKAHSNPKSAQMPQGNLATSFPVCLCDMIAIAASDIYTFWPKQIPSHNPLPVSTLSTQPVHWGNRSVDQGHDQIDPHRKCYNAVAILHVPILSRTPREVLISSCPGRKQSLAPQVQGSLHKMLDSGCDLFGGEKNGTPTPPPGRHQGAKRFSTSRSAPTNSSTTLADLDRFMSNAA